MIYNLSHINVIDLQQLCNQCEVVEDQLKFFKEYREIIEKFGDSYCFLGRYVSSVCDISKTRRIPQDSLKYLIPFLDKCIEIRQKEYDESVKKVIGFCNGRQ